LLVERARHCSAARGQFSVLALALASATRKPLSPVEAHDQLDLVDLLGDVLHGLELLEAHEHRVLRDHLGVVRVPRNRTPVTP
jgi:hypothetical protein